ncbi:MAG: hydroxysqualene dehydroxylase HpnE [Puniceicoccales bacterium]|nr:hydroxysqualene dehydroxylase HpnE [Puniceicoccales bacterium]
MASTDDQQQAQARRQSNLAIAFKIAGLDARRRRAMEVFYTFCRVADDIVDEPGSDEAKRAALDVWRAVIRGYFDQPGGTPPHDALARELAGVVREYAVPMQPLLDLLDGCAMDIGIRDYATAADLRRYCYGVASAVGLVSIRLFGCVAPLSEEFAVALGYALQFTNILRDVVEDYHELGRVYLPRDEMSAFGVTTQDLAAPEKNPQCVRLFRLQYFRARHYFNKARRLVAPEDRVALKAAFVMGAFYEAILEKIKARGFRLTRERIRLSKWEKIRLLRRALKDVRRAPVAVSMPKTVVVIGGGVAGAAAAAEAARAGHEVTLLEAHATPGGRAGSFLCGGGKVEIDHGHHAMFGCYHAFLRLADTLGVRDKLDEAACLDVPYRLPGGGVSRLRAVRALPAPLHLAAGLAGFSGLSWRDRWAILRLGLALRLGAGLPASGETAAAWLARHRQTPGAIRALWEPFCVAALNEPLSSGDAILLAATLRRTLFGGIGDSAIITSRVPLARLFAPELALALRGTGGDLRTGAAVSELVFSGDKVTAALLADGSAIEADVFILAVPWAAAARLLPELAPVAVAAKQIQGRPILNVHLFTKGELTAERFSGLLDSPVQWIFREAPGHYALTLSCPGDWMALPVSEIATRARAELAKFFPETAHVPVEDSVVCKYPNATFAATPQAASLRPGAATAWRNLFLAGDWTDTGLPATLEGAAQSGQTAVQAGL